MQTHEGGVFVLWCDDPACPARYASGEGTTAQDTLVLSAAAGWTTTGGNDFCPAHTDESAPVVLSEPEEISLPAAQFTPAVVPDTPEPETAVVEAPVVVEAPAVTPAPAKPTEVTAPTETKPTE